MDIRIELIVKTEEDYKKEPDVIIPGWKVSHGDKYTGGLTWDEMIGLIASITIPENKPCLQWLRTENEHEEWSRQLLKK